MEQTLNSMLEQLFYGSADYDMDIIEDDNRITIVIDTPGYESSDIDISVDAMVMKVSGTKKLLPTNLEDKTYIVNQRKSNNFSKSIKLSSGKLDLESIQAALKSGVLYVTIDRLKSSAITPKKIVVKNT